MAREIYPSSYECDCGHISHFFERTIREAKEMSHRKKVQLGDSAKYEHWIIFHEGKMVDIECPHRKSDSRNEKT
jgi:hypothetical protein